MNFAILLLVMLLVLWLFMIRPQRRRQQTQQAMMENLRIGDEIMTAGGLYGTISRISEDDVMVEFAPGMDVKMAKRAIAAVITPEPDEPEVAADTEEQRG